MKTIIKVLRKNGTDNEMKTILKVFFVKEGTDNEMKAILKVFRKKTENK